MRSIDHLRSLAFALLVAGPVILFAGVALSAPGLLDRFELLALLERGDFAEIENRITSVQEAYEAGQVTDLAVNQAFAAFKNTDHELAKILDRWVEASSPSYVPLMARAEYYRLRGWLSRGTDSDRKTSAKRFAGMKENFAVAIADLRAVIAMKPRLSVAYASLINLLKAMGDRKMLNKVMELGLVANPDSATIRWQYLFSIQPLWGGSRRHVSAFQTRIKQEQPDNRALGFLLGFLDYIESDRLIRAGKIREGVVALGDALESGDFWYYRLKRGKVAWRIGAYETSLFDFDRALELRPQSPRVFYERGWLHYSQGRYAESLRDFDAAVRLNRWEPEYLKSKAYALWSLKRHEEAVRTFEDALRFGAHSDEIWDAKGRLNHFWLKDYEQADLDLRRAIELNPKKAIYWYNLSALLHSKSDCGTIEAARTYLTLCKRSKSCPRDKVAWAAQNVELRGDSGRCPD